MGKLGVGDFMMQREHVVSYHTTCSDDANYCPVANSFVHDKMIHRNSDRFVESIQQRERHVDSLCVEM